MKVVDENRKKNFLILQSKFSLKSANDCCFRNKPQDGTRVDKGTLLFFGRRSVGILRPT